MENDFIPIVAKIHVLKPNVSCKLCIGNGSVGPVRMPPGPDSGALIALCEIAVFILDGVYKGYIPLIFLRCFIQQAKNALCPGQAHDYGVDLLGYLVDVPRKLPGHV